MKNYLCAYINHVQDDWVDHLPMAKFAANNHINASTKINPFFADNSFYPCMSVELPRALETSWRAKLLKADQIVANQEAMAIFLQDLLE